MSEKNERISMSELVEHYNKLSSEQLKDRYIKEHIKTTYAPLFQKRLVLETMNDKSVVESPVKYIDMTISKLNFIMAILILYTDIEPDKNENEDGTTTPLTWGTYDLLKSTGIYNKLMDFIGEDLEELTLVQGQIINTWTMKNSSTQSYINEIVETFSRKFGVYAGVGMEKLIEFLDDEEKVKKLIYIVDKKLKKIK